MRIDERLEVGDELGVTAGFELRRDPFFDRCKPQLVEALDLRLRPRLESEVGKRRPAPERQRLAQCSNPFGWFLRPGTLDQLPEALEIDLLGRYPQQVAGRTGLENVGAQRLSELGDEILQ